MVLKTISCLTEDTRLIRYKDTLYKIKLLFKDVANILQGREISVHEEIEEVIAAVIKILQNGESLVKIQTDHFLVLPAMQTWKMAQKLTFMQHGKELNVCNSTIYLSFMASSEDQIEKRTVSTSSKERSEAASAPRCLQDTNSRMNASNAQTANLSRGKSSVVSRNSNSVSTFTKPVQMVTSDNRVKKSTEPSAIIANQMIAKQSSSQAGGDSQSHGCQLSADTSAKAGQSQKTRPEQRTSMPLSKVSSRLSVPDNKGKTSMQTRSSADCSLDHRYNLREKLDKVSYSFSPSKSPRKRSETYTHREHHATVSSVLSGDVDSIRADDSSSKNVVKTHPAPSKGQKIVEQRQLEERQTPRQQTCFATEAVSTKSGHNNTSQNCSRSLVRSRVLLAGARSRSHHLSSDKLLAKRQNISKSTANEEERLRKLTCHQSLDSPCSSLQNQRPHGVEIFQQKDRHVIEESDAQEELKLQTLASSERLDNSTGIGQGRSGTKRNRNVIERFADHVVTPIKKALQGTDRTSH